MGANYNTATIVNRNQESAKDNTKATTVMVGHCPGLTTHGESYRFWYGGDKDLKVNVVLSLRAIN